LMAVGALVLLMLVPLAEESADAGPASGGWADALGALAVDANEVAYQSSQMLLAIGALFLCALLYRARLVPRFLAAWGLFGYATHMVGAIAEIFGVHVSLLLLIPGGVFEIVLGFWLIIKGFRREGYGGDSQVLSGPAVRPAPAKL
ncbi:MAG: DUF4386 domain-containing protein, partial [Nocardioidaceae bacterium]